MLDVCLERWLERCGNAEPRQMIALNDRTRLTDLLIFYKKQVILNSESEVKEMKKYVCDLCGYVYDEAAGDPDNGIPAGTKWEDVPDSYVCPLCGVGKDQFSEE